MFIRHVQTDKERVIANHLISAALVPDTSPVSTRQESVSTEVVPESKTGVLCYNVRGVGKSGGRQAWLGAGEEDYGAVERWGIEITGVKDIWRFVGQICTSSGTRQKLRRRGIHGDQSLQLTPQPHQSPSDPYSSSHLPYPH